MKTLMRFGALCLLLAGLFACGKSEYHQMVTREMASGERHDALLLDIEFGMSRDSFFQHCFALNRAGLVHQGMKNNSVEYPLPDSTDKGPARLNFYPEFHEDKLYKLPVTFRYDRWAPWRPEMDVDSILLDVVGILEEWYGPGFVPFGDKKTGRGWVKVNGNRRILVAKEDIQRVKFTFEDLTAAAPPPVDLKSKSYPYVDE